MAIGPPWVIRMLQNQICTKQNFKTYFYIMNILCIVNCHAKYF